MPSFNYSTGNPNNLVGGATAAMTDIQGPFFDLRNFLNNATGGLDESNLTAALLAKLGLNGTSNGRGGSFIAAAGTRANVAFGALSNGPDQVTVTLPTNGLVFVAFQATWSSSPGANAAQASIFLDSTQVKIAQSNVAAPLGQTVTNDGSAGVVTPLSTGPGGLIASAAASTTTYTGDVTTGQLVGNAAYEAAISGGSGVASPRAPMGGPCLIFAAAGTYAVSVQFLAATGTVTVTNRKLWVWTLGGF